MKGMVTNMKEIIISIVIGIAQIVLSSFLILRHKNKFAIASEIITSGLLFYILYNIEKIVSWNYILLVVIEFLLVKIFLIVFWIIVRVYSFYLIRNISKSPILSSNCILLWHLKSRQSFLTMRVSGKE